MCPNIIEPSIITIIIITVIGVVGVCYFGATQPEILLYAIRARYALYTHTTVYYTYYAFYSFIIIFPPPVSSSLSSSYYLVLFFFINSKHTPYTVDNNSTTFTRSLEWKIGPSGVGSVYIKLYYRYYHYFYGY